MRVKRFERRDWLAVAVLVVLSLVLRIPFCSRFAFNMDSAQFALAIKEYNVALGQPHPPGYFLYVMLGRMVNLLVQSPHESLVWLSVAFGSTLPAVLYLLGAAMFDRRTGCAAGLLAMTSPQMLFHSCVALTYVVDSFLVCVMVLWCWRAKARGGSWADAVGIGVLLAVSAGVRLQSLFLLCPAVALALWWFQPPRVGKILAGFTAAGVLTAVWFCAMVTMSGGLVRFLQAERLNVTFNVGKTFVARGWDALAWNVTFAAGALLNGLMIGALVLGGGLLYRAFRADTVRKRVWDIEHAQAMKMLAVWIASMMLLSTVVGFTDQPGHTLSYLPGFLLLTAVVLAQLRKRWVFAAATAVVCGVNIIGFLLLPAAWDEAFIGMGRSARVIKQHDSQLAQVISAIKSYGDWNRTVICHAQGNILFGLRHLQLYLPQYDQYLMTEDRALVKPAGHPFSCVRGGRLEFASRIDWRDKRVLLLVVPPGNQVTIFEPHLDVHQAESVPDSAGILYALPLRSEAQP